MSTKSTDDDLKLHDGLLISLTREQFDNFKHEDMKNVHRMSTPSHIEPHTPMATFTGHTKSSATSETLIALNNFKRGTKRDASAYPIFKNDLYYDTFQRSILAIIEAQGLYDVADPDYDPDDGDYYEQELFQEKQSFVYSVLVTSLQTDKGRELVKEFEGDARSILSKLYHHHTQSNIAQHEVVTLTTYITNLSLTDSWKGTTRQFFSHFKEKLRLLDSLVPDTDRIPETVGNSYRGQFNRIMIFDRPMSLILHGDPKQDQQENLLLRFKMIYFGMQLINMSSTKLQNKDREKPSFPIK